MIIIRIDGVKELNAALARVRKVISGSRDEAVILTNEALRILRKLTPTQLNTDRRGSTSRGFPSLRSQWDKKIISDTRNNYTAAIKSTALRTKSGRAVLGSVEFGAKPHIIRPRNKKGRLAWFSPKSVYIFQYRTTPTSIRRKRGQTTVEDIYSKESRKGGWIVLPRGRGVRHPGHHGFHMVRETTKQMAALHERSRRKLQARIRAAFAGLGVTIG